MYRTSSTPQHQHPPMLPLPRHRQQLYYESANNSSILGTTVNDNDDYNYQNEGRGALYPQQDYISNFQQQQLQQALSQHCRHYYDVDHTAAKKSVWIRAEPFFHKSRTFNCVDRFMMIEELIMPILSYLAHQLQCRNEMIFTVSAKQVQLLYFNSIMTYLHFLFILPTLTLGESLQLFDDEFKPVLVT